MGSDPRSDRDFSLYWPGIWSAKIHWAGPGYNDWRTDLPEESEVGTKLPINQAPGASAVTTDGRAEYPLAWSLLVTVMKLITVVTLMKLMTVIKVMTVVTVMTVMMSPLSSLSSLSHCHHCHQCHHCHHCHQSVHCHHCHHCHHCLTWRPGLGRVRFGWDRMFWCVKIGLMEAFTKSMTPKMFWSCTITSGCQWWQWRKWWKLWQW